MNTNLQKAQDLFFGKDGLGVENFKMYPGNKRDVSVDDVAGQVLRAINSVIAGEEGIVEVED